MNILMMTNTFTPHVGGVARSVEAFTAEYRRRGHRVLVVAPWFDGTPEEEEDVVRMPAIQHFNGSDFSVPFPIPGLLTAKLGSFEPQIVHSHHPFLLGDTALRVSASRNIPAVFTHHTRYEQYTHYVPGDSPVLQRFVVDLAIGYCNLCDGVIAPSESIAEMLRQQGVTRPVEVIPTGVNVQRFSGGDGKQFRRQHDIPADAFVVGHVGRLAPEKNLGLLARAIARFAQVHDGAHCLIAGHGPSLDEIKQTFAESELSSRLHLCGVLDPHELADCYAAMDVFAFASKSETQGMVLTEAMAAGTPVVAIDASGVREVVVDGQNGRMLTCEDEDEFAAALRWIAERDEAKRADLIAEARATAERFSMPRTADRALALYERLIESKPASKEVADSLWSQAMRLIEEEWKILSNLAGAVSDALTSESSDEGPTR